MPPLPRRVAEAIEPGATRGHIPSGRLVLGPDGVPYSGEIREEQWGAFRGSLAQGGKATLCGLRRAWRIVGFVVDPGTATSELTVQLRVHTAGVDGLTVQTWAIQPLAGPQAVFGLEVGARCELVVGNLQVSAQPAASMRGAIWGMNEE